MRKQEAMLDGKAEYDEEEGIMKKPKGLFLALLPLAACALLFLLPPLQREKEEREVPWKRKYTFISPFANNGYWGSAAHGIQRADEKYGCQTKFVSFSDTREDDIAGAICSAVYEDSDGIIAWGEESQAVEEAMETARREHVPIVLIDNDNQEIDRLCYIGTNNYEAGYMAGQRMCEGANGELHIVVILGSKSVGNQEQRLLGFQDALSSYPGCTLDICLEAAYSTLKVKEILPQVLKENPRINAIFCAEGYSSLITGEVLQSMGLPCGKIRVVAFDQSEPILSFIQSGWYYATIMQQCDRMGEEAIRILEEWHEGKLPEEDILYTEALCVTKDNLEQARRYESEGVVWHLFKRNLRQIQ